MEPEELDYFQLCWKIVTGIRSNDPEVVIYIDEYKARYHRPITISTYWDMEDMLEAYGVAM